MRCSSCGYENPDWEFRCGLCGAALRNRQSSETAPKPAVANAEENAPYVVLHSPFGAVTTFTKHAYYQSSLAFLVIGAVLAIVLAVQNYPIIGVLLAGVIVFYVYVRWAMGREMAKHWKDH